MNITLEEQIKYMQREVKYWNSCGDLPSVKGCTAILATLEAVRDEQFSPHYCMKTGLKCGGDAWLQSYACVCHECSTFRYRSAIEHLKPKAEIT